MRPHSHEIKLICALLATALFAFGISVIFFSKPVIKEEKESATTVLQESSDTPDRTPLPVSSLAFVSNGNGTCSVVGRGNCTDKNIIIPSFSPNGDCVTAIAPKAFFGTAEITAIHIPATVTFIGELALADCKDLAFLSVSADNPAYCAQNGVLYSKDRASLLLYPPKLAGSTVTVGAETVAIAEMAFYDCFYLRHFVYLGSAAAWEAVTVARGNYSLLSVSKEFAG